MTIDGGAGTNTMDLTQGPGSATVNFGTGIVHNAFGGTDHVSNYQIYKTGAGYRARVLVRDYDGRIRHFVANANTIPGSPPEGAGAPPLVIVVPG